MSNDNKGLTTLQWLQRPWALLVTLVAVGALAFAGCGGDDDSSGGGGGGGDAAGGLQKGTFTIGWAADRTEYLSFVDEPVQKGMEVAVDEINAAGGIDGKLKIKLDIRDMKADPALGATVVQELVENDAKFIVTTCDTDVSLPGAQIAAKNELPVMSSCGADALGPAKVPNGFGFLNVPGSLSQGAALAEFATKEGHKKAYIHLSKDEGYTQTLAEAFAARFKDLGGEIVGESRFNIGDTNYRVTATKMANSDADVIMTNTFPPDSTALLKDLERVGNDKPILLVDGNDTPVIWEGGPQLEHATMTTYGGHRGEGSGIAEFNKRYEQMFDGPPESLQTALGYDLVKVVAAAVTAAGSTDGPKIRDALSNLENVPGATGPITYKNSPVGQGLPKKLYAIVKFDLANRKFIVEDNVFPESIPDPE
jgi:branched-chain amino acid transport system substrate-binding protein